MSRAIVSVVAIVGRDSLTPTPNPNPTPTLTPTPNQTGVAGEEETFYQSFPGVPRGAASTQLTARGLTPCTGYRLRARARNSKGEGPWSPAFTCSTLEEVLPPLSYRPLATAP